MSQFEKAVLERGVEPLLVPAETFYTRQGYRIVREQRQSEERTLICRSELAHESHHSVVTG